ncbi:transglycosylase SLT domain-containing protein, partial [Mycobacteroides abscessus]
GMGGGFPMGGGMPLAPLGALGNLFSRTGFAQDAGHTSSNPVGDGLGGNVPSSENTSSAAAIPVSEVDLRKKGFPGGADAFRDYIGKTLDHKGITDPVARANWTRGFMTAASRESGFHPDAVNMSDSNAHGARMADGAPANSSRGGLQTIPSTFAANHEPGTSRSIYDPIANIAASMNYVMRRYHVARDGSNLSSVGQFNPHHAPGGY